MTDRRTDNPTNQTTDQPTSRRTSWGSYTSNYRLVVVCAVILMRATAQSRQKVICVSYVYSNYSENPPAHTSTYPKELELWTVNRIIEFPVVPLHFPATIKGKGGGGTLEGKNENSSPKSLQTN